MLNEINQGLNLPHTQKQNIKHQKQTEITEKAPCLKIIGHGNDGKFYYSIYEALINIKNQKINSVEEVYDHWHESLKASINEIKNGSFNLPESLKLLKALTVISSDNFIVHSSNLLKQSQAMIELIETQELTDDDLEFIKDELLNIFLHYQYDMASYISYPELYKNEGAQSSLETKYQLHLKASKHTDKEIDDFLQIENLDELEDIYFGNENQAHFRFASGVEKDIKKEIISQNQENRKKINEFLQTIINNYSDLSSMRDKSVVRDAHPLYGSFNNYCNLNNRGEPKKDKIYEAKINAFRIYYFLRNRPKDNIEEIVILKIGDKNNQGKYGDDNGDVIHALKRAEDFTYEEYQNS
ncbi:MAG: hypothetical protein HRT47_06215 [Candidatus Caenarcaniphilales bacterium]|nr:hypothetical protein [Candidatus Caenarcaniphilales bacterium]